MEGEGTCEFGVIRATGKDGYCDDVNDIPNDFYIYLRYSVRELILFVEAYGYDLGTSVE